MRLKTSLFVIAAAFAALNACTPVSGVLGLEKHRGPYADEQGRCFYVTKAGGRIYDPAARC
jgi:hypothetical protein